MGKKNWMQQTAGLGLRLEFWVKDEKPSKLFPQSYFGKKNHQSSYVYWSKRQISEFFFSKNDKINTNIGF